MRGLLLIFALLTFLVITIFTTVYLCLSVCTNGIIAFKLFLIGIDGAPSPWGR